MKVLISGETGYQNLFLELGYEVTNFLPTSDGDFDLLCLTGGTDISPSLYYQKQNFYTQSPNIARDSFEIDLYNTCVRNGIPIVGICRGAQLLCALNGGKLFQHVNNHHHPHLIKLNDGREIMVSSDHHQMMDLRDLSDIHDYILLGWADHLSSFYMNEETYILKKLIK